MSDNYDKYDDYNCDGYYREYSSDEGSIGSTLKTGQNGKQNI